MNKLLNENLWFKQQQPLLKWMANTAYGRDLLCIDKSFPQITEIAKNYIRSTHGKESISEFRVGAKWANVIRYRWKEFQEYAQEYYRQSWRLPVLFPVAPQMGYAYTTSTFYPDPDPETSSVDGVAYRFVSEESWASIRGGAGNGNNSTNTSDGAYKYQAGTTSNLWTFIVRSFFVFNTAAIPNGDNILSATLSLYGTAKTAGTSPEDDVTLVATTPASSTSIANADYAQSGSTRLAEDISNSSWSTSAYNDFALNGTGLLNISKTATSKFGCRFQSDLDNVAPTWASGTLFRAECYFADQTGTTNDPKLVVIHENSNFFMFMSPDR